MLYHSYTRLYILGRISLLLLKKKKNQCILNSGHFTPDLNQDLIFLLFLIKVLVNYYEWSTYESLYTTVIAYFWALNILNVKLTLNFCTPLNWRVKILWFCNGWGPQHPISQAEGFIAVLVRGKKDFLFVISPRK